MGNGPERQTGSGEEVRLTGQQDAGVGILRLLVFSLVFLSVLDAGRQGAMAAAGVSNPQGIAVIVGNADYGHRDIPDVLYAKRDARAFRRYVEDVLGFAHENVIVLKDATRAQMLSTFGRGKEQESDLWAKLLPDREWDVVVYYSGHGVPGLTDGKGYLLPVDVVPRAAQEEGYPLDLLYERLGNLAGARSVQVYIDACFSGASAAGPLVRSASPIFVHAELPEGISSKVTAVSAAGGNQVASWDDDARHGLFTDHLLDALYGKGDTDGDGKVTALEVEEYLKGYMSRAAWSQHRRTQRASILGAPGIVLASAPPDGFPKRPVLEPPEADTGAAARVKTEERVGGDEHVGEDAMKTPAKPASEIMLERGLRLSDWALLAEDRLARGDYRALLVEGMSHLRAHGEHASVKSVVDRAFAGLLEGLAITDEASAREALESVKRLRGVVGARAELSALEAQAHERLGRWNEAATAWRSWLGLAEAARTARGRSTIRSGKIFRDCEACPEMVVVPAGSFTMGSPASEQGRDGREGPRHAVTISRPFAVWKYEVTRGEYARFVDATDHVTKTSCWVVEGGKWKEHSGRHWQNPGFRQTERDPVVCVNWDDAQAYVRWLSQETGKEYRLLTEAEWEYAARARTTGPFHFGETISTSQANYNGNYAYGLGGEGAYRGKTVPVGSFPANGFGLHDMHGNVWELVEDCWHDDYRGAPSDGSAWTMGGNCGDRVMRGGSWFEAPGKLRSASGVYVFGSSYVLGFRVTRSLPR